MTHQSKYGLNVDLTLHRRFFRPEEFHVEGATQGGQRCWHVRVMQDDLM